MNQIFIYGGHGREFARTTYKDVAGNVFRGTGKEAKVYFRDLYPSSSLIFQQSRKR